MAGSDLSSLSLAELFRGIPESLDHTKHALESMLGPLVTVVEGFTDLKSAGEVVVGAVEKVVEALTDSAKAFIEAEASSRRLSAALDSSGTASLGAAEDLEEFNRALQRKVNKDADHLAQLQATALGYGIQAEQLKQATIQILALAEVTGSVESATKAVAQAHEGHFQKVSKLLGPISDLNQLNERLAVGQGLLANNAETTAGKLEGLGAATEDVNRALGKAIVTSQAFQAVLSDLRRGADLLASGINGLVDWTTKYSEALHFATTFTNPFLAVSREMLDVAHETFSALTDSTEAQVDLTLAEAESVPNLHAEVAALKERNKLRDEATKLVEKAAAAAKAAAAQELADLRAWLAEQETQTPLIEALVAARSRAFELGAADEFDVQTASLDQLNLYNSTRTEAIRQQIAGELLLAEAQRADTAEVKRAALADDKALLAVGVKAQKDATKDAADAAKDFQRAQQVGMSTFASGITNAVLGIAHSIGELAVSFSGHSVADNAKRMSLEVLKIIGQLAQFVGDAVVASAFAVQGFGNPITGIPAGLALAGIGAAILLAVGAAQASLSDSASPTARAFSAPSPNLGQDSTAGGAGPAAVEGGLPSPGAGGGRTFILQAAAGAIVGGDGRALGRDFIQLVDNARPSWAS